MLGGIMLWWQRQPAYRDLDLRWNPFGELTPAERGQLAVVDAGDADVIRPGRFRPVQIIADAGHGKTTHLLALAQRTAGAIYEYVPEGTDTYQSAPLPEHLFLLDEAQRVRPAHLRRLLRSHPWLVFGTHQDLSPFSPHPVRTLRLTQLSGEKLHQIALARLQWAHGQAPGNPPALPPGLLESLRQKHGANLRAIEDDLYVWYQNWHPAAVPKSSWPNVN